MISVIISSCIIIISIFILIGISFTNKNPVKTDLGLGAILVSTVFIAIGLIIIPILTTDHVKLIEIENFNLTQGVNCVIVDTHNSPESIYPNLFRFSSAKAFNQIGDSTKFYIHRELSFYNIETKSYIVWSNPPYKHFNLE